MKVNPGKCVQTSKCEKLGIKVDSKLSLKTHVEDLCIKSSRNIHAVARITPYMGLPKKPILFNAFFQIPV